MAFHESPLFEFNRFAPWELFCSAYRAGHEGERAKSPIERLHHNRSMLLFAFAGMEALLNYMIERLPTEANEDKPKFIRQKKLAEKLDYIEAKTNHSLERAEFDLLMEEYAFLRHEIVHHKRTDQQPQFHVQHVQPQTLLRLLQFFSVRMFIATHGEFPYWLTGWNYTGFNGNWRDLYLHNNGNGFSHTLWRMGYPFKWSSGPGAMNFADAHMSSLQHFSDIQSFLNGYPHEVEPLSPSFPQRPRLIRRWWLGTVIEAVEREVAAARSA